MFLKCLLYEGFQAANLYWKAEAIKSFFFSFFHLIGPVEPLITDTKKKKEKRAKALLLGINRGERFEDEEMVKSNRKPLWTVHWEPSRRLSSLASEGDQPWPPTEPPTANLNWIPGACYRALWCRPSSSWTAFLACTTLPTWWNLGALIWLCYSFSTLLANLWVIVRLNVLVNFEIYI